MPRRGLWFRGRSVNPAGSTPSLLPVQAANAAQQNPVVAKEVALDERTQPVPRATCLSDFRQRYRAFLSKQIKPATDGVRGGAG